MVFVNFGGGGYWFFEHSKWNGEFGVCVQDSAFNQVLGNVVATEKKCPYARNVMHEVISRFIIILTSYCLFKVSVVYQEPEFLHLNAPISWREKPSSFSSLNHGVKAFITSLRPGLGLYYPRTAYRDCLASQ